MLHRAALRLEDWARVRILSRIKSLFLFFWSGMFSPRMQLHARSLYLVAWHPAWQRNRIVAKTLRIAARRKVAPPMVTQLMRSILLKPPVSERERGILLISFEPELAKLARLKSLSALESKYAIVFLPTWQPFYSEALFAFAARARWPYWLMPSSTIDQALCTDLGTLCRPLPFQASSWVSRTQYAHLNPAKTVDLLMVANFSAYKRHWRLFEALSYLPHTIRTVLAGRPHSGRTAETLRREAEAFGVRERIEIHEDPTDSALAQLLASAKLFCALSHREGSYIAVAESLMAGTPVAMFSDAAIGSREYIGDATGFFLNPRQSLGPQLSECLTRAPKLRPREWASAHIAAEVNCARLNARLRDEALSLGNGWTVDLSGFFCRHFDFEYLDVAQENIFREEYALLATECGLEIQRSQLDVRHSVNTR